jgi:hypothetical protein
LIALQQRAPASKVHCHLHWLFHMPVLSTLQAVRTVFNIAIGADSADLQRTARSALLQMLNTIVKRVSVDNPVSILLHIDVQVENIASHLRALG